MGDGAAGPLAPFEGMCARAPPRTPAASKPSSIPARGVRSIASACSADVSARRQQAPWFSCFVSHRGLMFELLFFVFFSPKVKGSACPVKSETWPDILRGKSAQ